MHGPGSSCKSSESTCLGPVVLPGEILDDLGSTVDFVANLVDGVGWLALRGSLPLGDAVHALVLEGKGKDSLDGILVCLLLFASDTEGVGSLAGVVESAEGERGL